MKDNSEVVEQYYDLEEFVKDVQYLARDYEGKIDKNYIEQLDAIWCDAENEKESLEEIVKEIEEAEIRQQNYEYERSVL